MKINFHQFTLLYLIRETFSDEIDREVAFNSWVMTTHIYVKLRNEIKETINLATNSVHKEWKLSGEKTISQSRDIT